MSEVVSLQNPSKQAAVQTQSDPNDMFKANQFVCNGHFKIINKIGQGGFGEIYKVMDTRSHIEVALKVEEIDASRPNMEPCVLKRYKVSKHCPAFYENGNIDQEHSFIAMQLLGTTLSTIRKHCSFNPPRLSLNTAFRTYIQCIRAIEELHNVGFVHRDISPLNFAIGSAHKDETTVYLFDFGLCRYYLNADGSLRKLRLHVPFRGTIKYASLSAHEEKDMGRNDDIISSFYTFYELMTGTLPWNEKQENEVVGQLKKSITMESMCNGLPTEMVEFVKLICVLNFEDTPAYDEMVKCFERALKRLNAKADDHYEWQLPNCKSLVHCDPKHN